MPARTPRVAGRQRPHPDRTPNASGQDDLHERDKYRLTLVGALIAGAAGLLGALVGAGGALWVASMNLDAQRSAQQAEFHEQQEAEIRSKRESAYADFLTAYEVTERQGSQMGECVARYAARPSRDQDPSMARPPPPEECHALIDGFWTNTFRDLWSARDNVFIYGSSDAVKAAYQAVNDVRDKANYWEWEGAPAFFGGRGIQTFQTTACVELLPFSREECVAELARLAELDRSTGVADSTRPTPSNVQPSPNSG